MRKILTLKLLNIKVKLPYNCSNNLTTKTTTIKYSNSNN